MGEQSILPNQNGFNEENDDAEMEEEEEELSSESEEEMSAEGLCFSSAINNYFGVIAVVCRFSNA